MPDQGAELDDLNLLMINLLQVEASELLSAKQNRSTHETSRLKIP